jgi:RHS repeat-associated protein
LIVGGVADQGKIGAIHDCASQNVLGRSGFRQVQLWMAPLVDYRYDNTANRVGVTEASGDRVTGTYDATYQLTRERRSGVNGYDVTHVYDPAGNRTLKLDGGSRTTSVYNGANQIVWSQDGSGRTTITYDADGNLTREVKPSGQITTSVWDAENMNSAVLLPDTTRVTYTYNADHLRVRKDTASGTRKYVFDLQNPFTETDGSDVTQAVYVVEPQTYGNIVSQRQLVGGIWNSVYYHFDALGSTGSLSDGMAVVTDTYTYTAFGETKASTGTTTNVYTWVGELGYFRDSETGSYNLHERPYEPDKARMKNPDPLGLEVDPNEYRIVGNNPVNAVDPSGLEKIWFEFHGFIPADHGVDFPATRTGEKIDGKWIDAPDGWYYATDNRNFGGGTSRVYYRGWVESTRLGSVMDGDWGATYGTSGSKRVAEVYDSSTKSYKVKIEKLDSDVHGKAIIFNGTSGTTIRLTASGGDPFLEPVAPNLDFTVDFNFDIDCKRKNKINISINGTRDAYPNFEAFVTMKASSLDSPIKGKSLYKSSSTNEGFSSLLVGLNTTMLFGTKQVSFNAETLEP